MAIRRGDWPDAGLCLAVAFGLLVANLWLRVARLGVDDFLRADFVAFYAASVLAGGADPAATYDVAAHLAAERAVQGSLPAAYLQFLYPPTALLLVGALSSLPYLAAFGGWIALQIGLFAAATRVLGRSWMVAVFCLAFPPAVQAGIMGQNSMITAALLAAGPVLMARGWHFLGGFALGCLCYKPHFGILVPVAILAARDWRAFAGAAVAVIAMAAGSAAVFGAGVWHAYIAAVATGVAGTYVPDVIPLHFYASVAQSLIWAGVPSPIAWFVQAVASLLAVAAVVAIWRNPATAGRAARPASLAAGTMLAMPILMFYDALVGAVAIAAIVGEARRTGWLPWEKAFLGIMFPVLVMWEVVGRDLHLPYGPVLSAGLLILAWRRRRPDSGGERRG